MKRATSLVLATLVMAALLVAAAVAQPTLQGALSGTLGPGTYNVVGNCTVNAGAVLTIQPGTRLQFTGHFSLKVYGTLMAVGTAQDSIEFVRQYPNTTCEWGGIRFQSGASATSTVSYCLIEGARFQVYPDYNGGGLYTQNVGFTLSHSKIANCYSSSGGGIYVHAAPVTISDCIFLSNEAGNGGGIYLYNCNGAQVRNTILAKNSSTST